METRELARIDLNLLIALQVLLEDGSVSRAATRLHITQPAMSKTLSRLRQVFADPLFTRSSHGMRPTPRAEELATGLEEVLAGVQRLVAGSQFDPFASSGEINLALSEYIGLALLPELLCKLQSRAPQLNIRVITRVENQLEELALGKLDFAIQVEHAHYGSEFRVDRLGPSPATLLARHDHPLVGGDTSWERLAQFPLIRLYVSELDQLEIQRSSTIYNHMLESHRGSLEISHLLTALEVLRRTDYIMPSPAYILQNEAATRGIVALPLPEAGSPSINYALVGHRRTANSALHNWLWEQITCTIRELRTPLPRKLRQRVAAGSADPFQQQTAQHEQDQTA